jgi:hypothetical protein
MFRAPQELDHLKSSTRGSVISVHILLLQSIFFETKKDWSAKD